MHILFDPFDRHNIVSQATIPSGQKYLSASEGECIGKTKSHKTYNSIKKRKKGLSLHQIDKFEKF